jgi:SAM-dependent methyltransferase
LLIAAHFEIQRLSEEFDQGRRAMELLAPILEVLRAHRLPLRLVDVGCGTGFVIRWLAAHANWSDVELCGADFNPALVGEAKRLADAEQLRCRFRVANAFTLAEPASIFISTGVLHHFRGEGLNRFFAQHDREGAHAFAHFDFQPSKVAPIGSWLLHAARMRLPLSKHDGVLSAVRAHPGERLLVAARTAAPGFAVSLYGQKLGPSPLPRAFQTVLGVRPNLRDELVRALGGRASRLGGFS